MVTLNAHFDGKAIVLDEPLSPPLQPGARLRVSVESLHETHTVTPAPRIFLPLNIQVDPQLSNAIALDPQFNIEES
jgi:hypothetical protein